MVISSCCLRFDGRRLQQLLVRSVDLRLDGFEQIEPVVHEEPLRRSELGGAHPEASPGGESLAFRGDNQAAVKGGQHGVLDGDALLDEQAPMGDQLPHCPGLLGGKLHAWQEVGMEEPCQRIGVDLVGLDLGVCDGLHLQGVGHHDPARVLGDDGVDRPAVEGRLQNDLIAGTQALGPAIDLLGRAPDPILLTLRSLVIELADLDEFLVDIESVEHACSPLEPWETG